MSEFASEDVRAVSPYRACCVPGSTAQPRNLSPHALEGIATDALERAARRKHKRVDRVLVEASRDDDLIDLID